MNILNQCSRTLAAILTDCPLAVDDALACFALALRERGVGVRGFLATSCSLANGASSQAFIDLDSYHTIQPTNVPQKFLQPEPGNDSERFKARLHDIAGQRADLVLLPSSVVSIATRQEFSKALSTLINASTPVLTSVRCSHFADWQALSNNRFTLLQPTVKAMFDWIETIWQNKKPTFH